MSLTYHHCINLDRVVYDAIHPHPDYSEHNYLRQYRWLEKQAGFYPLFVGVGTSDSDIYITGYSNNWEEEDPDSEGGLDDDPFNGVLFSFSQVEKILFSDYMDWNSVLNTSDVDRMSESLKTRVLRPAWSHDDWLNRARVRPGCVQGVVPSLDLRRADRIWVKDEATRLILERMGFTKILIHQLLYPHH